ncbi:MAG: hypothetical protein FD174_1866 [Geobacteraceae bacterium]|nr:MAG: hypothetical protein FD174_1866 [Geobacteraceae bacterium]
MKLLPGSTQGKIATSLILALVFIGTTLVSGIGEVAQGTGVMTKLFLVFMGAIIAIQVIPGLILLGAMIRGLSTLSRREAVKEAEIQE